MIGAARAGVAAAVLCLGAVGCSSAPGTLEIRIYGEDFIEKGIPAEEFSDGWAVTFEHFLVSVSRAEVAQGHGAAALAAPERRVYDLVVPSMGRGALVASGMVPGGSYDHVAYAIGPAATGATGGTGTDATLVQSMVGAGDAVRVAGKATRAGRTVAFEWAFTSTVVHACHTASDVDGGTSKAELTIHGDHLFYDDLVARAPNLAFELIAAADGNGDGQVTRDELAARDITREARYQVGSFPVKNLWEFITHQVTTLGHIDGEGHCTTISAQLAPQLTAEPTHERSPMHISQASALASYWASLAALALQVSRHLATL